MITQNSIIILDSDLKSKLSDLKRDKEYYLFCDEGGMMGTPHFIVSNSAKLNKFNFERLFKASRLVIKDYIMGRLATWQIGNNEDYSNLVRIQFLNTVK